MGGMKHDEGKPEFDRISWQAVGACNKVHVYGNIKYEIDNWKKGIRARRLINAAFRHLYAILDGELIDPESGLLHAAHAMTNCEMLTHYLLNAKEYAEFIDVMPEKKLKPYLEQLFGDLRCQKDL